MVHNIVRHSLLPFSNARLKTLNSQSITGRGNGSVLLRTGGGGSASSYMDMDDYIHTTGLNPFTRATPNIQPNGKGLSKLAGKLSALTVTPPSQARKKKNIQLSI